MKKVPNLLKQAGNGIACALRVLFRLYSPDMLDGTADVPADEAANLDQDSTDRGAGIGAAGVPVGLQVLPPEEVRARQELAEGYVLLFILASLTHATTTEMDLRS
eukprot:COSAG02_NODE_471_length_21662_cov_70.510040_19_plen_105_part_00